MARRREAPAAAQAGSLAVPAFLLPVTALERRYAALGDEPVPSDEITEQAELLTEWLGDHGVQRKDYQARNAAIWAGQKLKSEARKASHSAPSQRMRKR